MEFRSPPPPLSLHSTQVRMDAQTQPQASLCVSSLDRLIYLRGCVRVRVRVYAGRGASSTAGRRRLIDAT